MHELALAQEVADIVAATARKHGVTRVTAVRVEIGELAHVEPEALEFCFASVVRGTVAQSARLEIERTPGVAWCMPCGDTVPLARRGEACPVCGSHQLTPVRGEELRVRDIQAA